MSAGTIVVNGTELSATDVRTPPIGISGFAFIASNRTFDRLPEDRLATFRKDLVNLSGNTAGGAVRFRTDSDLIGAKVVLTAKTDMQHMPRTGSNGVDLYEGDWPDIKFQRVIYPGDTDSYEGFWDLPAASPGAMRSWTLHMPLYDGVREMHVLLRPGSRILAPEPYRIAKPILFYGSSITQGGCASRPGNSHVNLIARALDAEAINLGFSGNALGDPEMAELIAGLDLSAFVMEYDYNAHDAPWLRKTHRPFFETVRRAHPDLPIVLTTKPDPETAPRASAERRRIVLDTYEAAVAAGDRHVHFIGGEALFGDEGRDACTVDGTHPNDLGFYRMAQAMLPTIRKAMSI